LGLAIVKAIALMHGGVVVRSEAGANTFGISLPSAQLRGFAVKVWYLRQSLLFAQQCLSSGPVSRGLGII
jgi:hypothetical protein